MEIQEMIDVLRDISNINLLSYESYKRNTISAVIENLERQLHKTPEITIAYLCPNSNCGKPIYEEFDYCPECSQFLDWEGIREYETD